MSLQTTFKRVPIGELKVSSVRDAVIVTQHPWFMSLLKEHHLYFFNAELGAITPMQYLLFYETTKEEDGVTNENPRHIAYWGKVKEIIYDVKPVDIIHIPELHSMTNELKYWNEIKTWKMNHIVLLEEIGEFKTPLPLEDSYQARYLVNKTTTFPKLRDANTIDKLYKEE
ncbi:MULTISPECIES: hypothetical protein [Bacillus cereus group]|uniref:hypothetical protein n=1 Tax=Bacillus cereus group TaxID=86661 RepID=UPI0022E45B1B|nr:hypothetical protein [Bacillus cereus group sp. TH152-1LC]MDA1675327.1 hypothetical protein [Bacillus cereus group sp. TH152-1LC]